MIQIAESRVTESLDELAAEREDTIAVEGWPFVLDEVELPPDDPEAGSFVTVKSWRPGTRLVPVGPYGEGEDVADALGAMLLTVISTHKLPRPYPSRVFYIRQWRDPEGKVFGKRNLRVLSRGAFTSMARGYRHPFEMSDEKEQA